MKKSFIREEESSPVPVHEAVAVFLHSPEVKQLQPGTQAEYEQELTRFAEWARTQEIMLHQVNAKAVSAFLDYLRATRKPHKAGKTEISTYTLHSHVRVLLTFLNWCVDAGEYDDMVSLETIRRIKKPKVIKTIVETFTDEQIAALRAACAKEYLPHLRLRDEAIILLLLDSGIRASELCGLTIANVDLSPNNASVKIFGKGQRWGVVPFGTETRKMLSLYARKFRLPALARQVTEQSRGKNDRQIARLEADLKEQQPFFMNRYGEPLKPAGLDRVFRRLGEWADIQGVRCSPHTLRHSMASRFMLNGGDIYTLSRILRHSSVKVTENYLASIRQWEAARRGQSVVDNL